MNLNQIEIQNLLLNLVFAILFLVSILYWFDLAFFPENENKSESYRISDIGKWGIRIIIGILFFVLYSRWITAGYFPLTNLYESLLFLTWLLLVIYLYIESRSWKRNKSISAIVIPIALFVNGFATLALPPEMQNSNSLIPALQSNWLTMHVTTMLLSYAALIVGSAISIFFLAVYDENPEREMETIIHSLRRLNEEMYGYVENREKKIDKTTKRPMNLAQIKYYENIANCSYRMINFGFSCLTVGIISGSIWANEAWGSYWSWDPKETWSLITWIIFAIYLHVRINNSCSKKTTAFIGSLGFISIWICYLGVNFLGKGLHSYGWL